jgi:hypothetical protein
MGTLDVRMESTLALPLGRSTSCCGGMIPAMDGRNGCNMRGTAALIVLSRSLKDLAALNVGLEEETLYQSGHQRKLNPTTMSLSYSHSDWTWRSHLLTSFESTLASSSLKSSESQSS